MSWLKLRLNSTGDQAGPLSELLEVLGAESVTLQDGADDAIFEPPPSQMPLWKNTIVSALFAPQTSMDDYLAAIEASLGSCPPYEISKLEDRVWERQWLKHFKAMRFGNRLWVCPKHLAPPDPHAVNVILDPGLAFGTGTHATTRLCLQWLDKHIKPGQTVVDYGCGSGILAIAAMKLGAARAWAVDLDPQALIATAQNTRDNRVDDTIAIGYPNTLNDIQADVVIANILIGPLQELAAILVSLTAPGGYLVLSGIMKDQVKPLCDRYHTLIRLHEHFEADQWCCLAGKRQAKT